MDGWGGREKKICWSKRSEHVSPLDCHPMGSSNLSLRHDWLQFLIRRHDVSFVFLSHDLFFPSSYFSLFPSKIACFSLSILPTNSFGGTAFDKMLVETRCKMKDDATFLAAGTDTPRGKRQRLFIAVIVYKHELRLECRTIYKFNCWPGEKTSGSQEEEGTWNNISLNGTVFPDSISR